MQIHYLGTRKESALWITGLAAIIATCFIGSLFIQLLKVTMQSTVNDLANLWVQNPITYHLFQ